jgi:hypothetical protein
MDILFAVPLGIFAGALATLFSSFGERAVPAARKTRRQVSN